MVASEEMKQVMVAGAEGFTNSKWRRASAPLIGQEQKHSLICVQKTVIGQRRAMYYFYADIRSDTPRAL